MRLPGLWLAAAVLAGCSGASADTAPILTQAGDFSFAYVADVHLQPQHRYEGLPQVPELSPLAAFRTVVDSVNNLDVDFVLNGGDLVYDVMRGQPHSDSLFLLYQREAARFEAPVHNAIGNHELYGIYDTERPIDAAHPDYKWGMFERYFGRSYSAFDHEGWHFILLNSIDSRGDGSYFGGIDDEQVAWLTENLARVDPETPIVVVSHIPFLTVQRQVHPSPGGTDGVLIANGPEVLRLFSDHNLKLVLQSHLHWTEELYVAEMGTRFITGGAVAGRPSWQGFRHGAPGFIVVSVRDGEISWRFVDYGWQGVVEGYRGSEEGD